MDSQGHQGAGRPTDALGMEIAEMRRLAHWVVDVVVDHFESGAAGAAVAESTPQQLAAIFGGPPPRHRRDPRESMELLVKHALGNMQHGDHPRYFARVPGPSSFAGVLGDWLATGHNAIAASWAGGSGPAAVELVVIDWLRDLLGMPEGTEGVLASGGSMANLIGLAAARHSTGAGVAYTSDQTHASIIRGLRGIGFPPDHIRVLPSDELFRLDPEQVLSALEGDRLAGRRPGFVIATAGTTNCGAVDPIDRLAEICTDHGMWLHVDGAYGAPAALTDVGRTVLSGIERADSLVLDPHKWLFQPYDIGCVLVRHPGALARAFSMTPEYLADATARATEVDLRDRTVELTRPARALKLWLTFHTYGLDRIRAAISAGIALAEHAEGVIRSDPHWEVVTPAQLAMVTFARVGASVDAHASAAAALAGTGFAAVTSTRLHGQSVLRLCTINPMTTHDDIDETIRRLDEIFTQRGA